MPIYEFKCGTCGYQFERLQKMDEKAPVCPKTPEAINGTVVEPCGATTTKMISGSSFHLKGSGWESDGYS